VAGAQSARLSQQRRGREMNRHGAILVVVLLVSILAVGCEDEPTSISDQQYSEVVEGDFAVGDSSTLTVENFVGSVDVRPGDVGIIRVVATRWAEREADLAEIEVEMIAVPGGVRIVTENPLELDDVSVDLEITTPSDTRPTLQNGVGSTNYVGRAEGACYFQTGVGSITLQLSADVNVAVQLAVGVGSINVAFPVVGEVSEQLVSGIIGTGLDGQIYAQVGVGTMRLVPQ